MSCEFVEHSDPYAPPCEAEATETIAVEVPGEDPATMRVCPAHAAELEADEADGWTAIVGRRSL